MQAIMEKRRRRRESHNAGKDLQPEHWCHVTHYQRSQSKEEDEIISMTEFKN